MYVVIKRAQFPHTNLYYILLRNHFRTCISNVRPCTALFCFWKNQIITVLKCPGIRQSTAWLGPFRLACTGVSDLRVTNTYIKLSLRQPKGPKSNYRLPSSRAMSRALLRTVQIMYVFLFKKAAILCGHILKKFVFLITNVNTTTQYSKKW